MAHLLVSRISVAAVALLLCSPAIPANAPEASVKLVLDVAGKGKVEITLAPDKAPKTCEHLVQLAQSGFYSGQKFIKAVKSPKPFLVQFGDPNSRTKPMDDPELGKTGSGKQIPYEDSGLPNVRGAVGLSTLPKDRNSGDSIFYVSLAENRFLDGKYTVFGHVTKGIEVVDKVEVGDEVSSVTVVRG